MVYRIEVVGDVAPDMLTGKFMSLLRATTSFDHIKAAVASLTSLLSDHQIVVYSGSLPSLRIDVFRGREKRRIEVGDFRKPKEIEQDFRYERGKLKFLVGPRSGDMSSWIAAGHSDSPAAVKGMSRKTSVKHRVTNRKTPGALRGVSIA